MLFRSIERDDHIPALDMLLAELDIARGIAQQVAQEIPSSQHAGPEEAALSAVPA